MPYLSCKKIENDVYNFPTWQYCKYKDIFDSRIIINSTAKFYISISYQKDLLSIDTRIFTPSVITHTAHFNLQRRNWKDWLVNIGAYIYYSFTTFGCIFMLVNASLCKVSSEKKIPIKP